MRTSGDCAAFEHLLVLANDPLIGYTASQLSALVLLIKARENLRSLSLPAALHPSFPVPLPTTEYLLRNRVLAVCKTRGVDSVWHLYSKTERDDVCVSRDYWEYAKKSKRRKQAAHRRLEIAGTSLNG